VGPENFEILKKWLVNLTGNFDIGPKFTQVGVVQYSDYPVLEVPLGSPGSGGALAAAVRAVRYLGGNTRTGRAIRFALDYLFAQSPRFLTKVAVVLTDGKSQDEVQAAAQAARDGGVTLFAIGVGAETEDAELRAIANKPASTYVFYVEDYMAISKIREVMKQKLCEGESATHWPPRSPGVCADARRAPWLRCPFQICGVLAKGYFVLGLGGTGIGTQGLMPCQAATAVAHVKRIAFL
jgi:collagen type XXI alpha